MPTLAQALTPFLLPEMPEGVTVLDTAEGIAVYFEGTRGKRWFQRSSRQQVRFAFHPEVFQRLLDSILQSPEDSHLQDVDYLEHAAAVMGQAVEQWQGETAAREGSFFLGTGSDGLLQVADPPPAATGPAG